MSCGDQRHRTPPPRTPQRTCYATENTRGIRGLLIPRTAPPFTTSNPPPHLARGLLRALPHPRGYPARVCRTFKMSSAPVGVLPSGFRDTNPAVPESISTHTHLAACLGHRDRGPVYRYNRFLALRCHIGALAYNYSNFWMCVPTHGGACARDAKTIGDDAV